MYPYKKIQHIWPSNLQLVLRVNIILEIARFLKFLQSDNWKKLAMNNTTIQFTDFF